MKILRLFLAIAFLATASSALASPSSLISGDPQEVPIKGMVTMVDVGAKACIPCKMMIPVIESLSEEYEGRAAIVFIDVWKNPDETPKFGLRAIPTQIFYDKDGKEVMRHEGYFSKEEIIKVLTKLGVE
ncbi:thioredoxin 1 [Desulfomicrobium apsheronum]|jgi:thioredoxin 1|uniref:Thioredoxin 1 n=1 Tax=Desulfomicrobium apsheronum TaxID=52560 RepID=A0A1I3T0M9_9BACT|nr:thioredoxin family protein [Desulfomicrobium apsheronum]MDY0227539.1 thioredoxin family protein [Desulfomicrobium apsheronum]SFJ64495.1 thioredoxin 1 [Desulfomicrobium apsheronum]